MSRRRWPGGPLPASKPEEDRCLAHRSRGRAGSRLPFVGQSQPRQQKPEIGDRDGDGGGAGKKGEGGREITSTFLETLEVGCLSSAASGSGLDFLGSNLDLGQVISLQFPHLQNGDTNEF